MTEVAKEAVFGKCVQPDKILKHDETVVVGYEDYTGWDTV